MAEPRKKTHHIMLNVAGRIVTIHVFDSRLWPQADGDEHLWRLRIEGKWYCPMGKYTFLTYAQVGEVCAQILAGDAPISDPEPEPSIKAGAEVYIENDLELFYETAQDTVRGKVVSNPVLGPDGCWWVECRVSMVGLRFVKVNKIKAYRG